MSVQSGLPEFADNWSEEWKEGEYKMMVHHACSYRNWTVPNVPREECVERLVESLQKTLDARKSSAGQNADKVRWRTEVTVDDQRGIAATLYVAIPQ